MLNKYFACVFEIEGSSVLPEFQDRNFDHILSHIDINEYLVGKASYRLKPSKSHVPDNIHPKLLKECKASIVPPLTIIFKKSLHESSLTSIWKQANVTAIHKKVTRQTRKLSTNQFNFGSMLNTCQEIFFSPFQHGVISGKSCVIQLLEFLDEITEALYQGEDVDIIYLDFSKAFDKLPHKRLMKRLWGYGIRGKTYKWIKAFLNNRSQKSSCR